MQSSKFLLLCAIFNCIGSALFSQTGPAGVNTSATNVLWLKADAGTSSTSNNAPLSAWNDQSGNGIHVTQTVSVQQPSFATNLINGFPGILFDNVNTPGQNDKLVGPDSPLLDNTSGYTFFTVTRPMNFGDAHVIVSKRTGVSVDQSFMLFYYTGNKLTIDIQTTDNRFSSNTTYATATNYITGLTYDGAVATSSLRCNLYNEEVLDKTAAESSTLVPDNASPLLIGTTDAGDERPYGGYMSEIIIYREALSTAKRIIVNNYLSAKYNIALSANDKYAGDNSGNGDYDRDVAGVGQESTGSSSSFSASVSGGLAMAANSGLDNGDYILAGHAVATNTTITTDVAGMTGPANARWLRIWYVDVTNTSTNINTTMEFDMSDGGMSPFTFGSVSNYVLLYRAGQSGVWLEVATAATLSGDKIIFNNVTLVNDGYYTLGTKNYNNSPLPITLIYFKAVAGKNKVALSWATASEKNARQFIVERTQNGTDFETVLTQPAAGQSTSVKTYSGSDETPYAGLAYYRLTEISTDGKPNHFPLTAVFYTTSGGLTVFPNPVENTLTICAPVAENVSVNISIKDLAGKLCFEKTMVTQTKNQNLLLDLKNELASGTYVLSVLYAGKFFEQKIILK